MKDIYLVRHGEAADDVEGLFGGAADHEPTEKGLRDAEKFAMNFKNKEIDIVITSPYRRAKDPAKTVAKKLNVPVVEIEDLRERNHYGILTGMSHEGAAKKHPDLVEAVRKPASEIEGAEPNKDFRKRVPEAIEKIWERPEKKALVFTHLGVILAALDLHYGDLEVEHYGWVKIQKENKEWKTLESEKVIFNKQEV
ncbi:MAG: histidine phosphatase family protein [Candidatus Woykebacteria bacterium]